MTARVRISGWDISTSPVTVTRLEIVHSTTGGIGTYAVLNPGVDDQIAPNATEHVVENVPEGVAAFEVRAYDSDNEGSLPLSGSFSAQALVPVITGTLVLENI